MAGAQVYDLTPLTRSFKERRVVINGFDVSLRHLVVFVTGLLPCLVVVPILWAIIGEFALFALVLIEGVWFWLIVGRSATGTHEVNWRAIVRKRTSLNGKFVCCGKVVDPLHGTWGRLVPSSVPVHRHPLAQPVPEVVVAPQGRHSGGGSAEVDAAWMVGA